MVITIDRIEGKYAVVEMENLDTIAVPVELFPNCHEGAVYEIVEREDAEKERKGQIKDLFDSLKK